MNDANSDYWLNKSGDAYFEQQVGRSGIGDESYRAQERWLTAFLHEQAEKLGRPVRVLEFGCGFGRFARILAADDQVAYHGYDFSSSMVKPLFDEPPPSLSPLDARVRVAPTVGEAFVNQYFDVIFTVSVLIHNSPQQAASLIDQMTAMTTSAGCLCLIENALVPLTMKENNWHGGCWVHDFVGTTAPELDACVTYRLTDVHSAYRLSVSRESERRLTLIHGGNEERPTSLDELRLLGMERLKLAAALLEVEVDAVVEIQAKVHDHDEFAKYATERAERLQHSIEKAIESLHAGLRRTQGWRGAESASVLKAYQRGIDDPAVRLNEVVDEMTRTFGQLLRAQTLRGTVTAALAQARALEASQPMPVVPGGEPRKSAEIEAQQALGDCDEFGWDHTADIQWQHVDDRFSRVCHLMNVEWIGIRAAAGCLPGHKLVISAKKELSAVAVAEIAQVLTDESIERLVVHGMSPPIQALILALREALNIPVYLVWHGAPTMWAVNHESELINRVFELLGNGAVRRVVGMRSGMAPVFGTRGFGHQMFNLPPTLPPSYGCADVLLPHGGRREPVGAIVFVPSWHVLHKNLPTNLVAANQSDKVGRVWTLDDKIRVPRGLDSKIRHLSPRSLRGMLDTMKQVDLVMNVSLVDCHPMIELEALAVRTPCLRGPLFMDALDDHPYVAATLVENALSVADVMKRIDSVLDIPRDEIVGMMADYERELRELSIARYCEFLEL